MLRKVSINSALPLVNRRKPATVAVRCSSLSSQSFPPPRLFTYEMITSNLKSSKQLVKVVEEAFQKLSLNEVDVPLPMHIGIHEKGEVGPGDCHIKGGYIAGAATWTVKLANVSFYKNQKRGLPVGSGIFIVCSAENGAPLGIFQENRYLTDLRTGAAGAVAVKHFAAKDHHRVAYIGTGAIATAMAEASHCVHQFEQGYAYGLDKRLTQAFANDIHNKLGYRILVCDSAEEAVRNADVIFTQTPGSAPVLEPTWLKPQATIIASGSDQATKNELPVELLKSCKFVTDLTRQCQKVGELRTAIQHGGMTVADVYAELGEVVSGSKPGRQESDGIVVVDLTGTGAQDAAIGQLAWDTLSKISGEYYV